MVPPACAMRGHRAAEARRSSCALRPPKLVAALLPTFSEETLDIGEVYAILEVPDTVLRDSESVGGSPLLAMWPSRCSN